MCKDIIATRTLGLNFLPGDTANIRVWAPLAQAVEVLIKGKESLPLTADESGYWELRTSEIKPCDTYQFIIDNDRILPDPASLYQPEGVHGPSQAFNLNAFTWSDKEWRGIHPWELIIYEIHTGTFTPEGTFEAITGKLGYLKELGITAIEIMPVAQFPGSRNWGYDGVFPFAVQNSYGGPEGLQKLIEACHREGMAVILDVVYNHLGPEGNYFSEFGPYFTDKYSTPWGRAINFDDAWCDGVRRYCIENALMWLRDFHIDGLRLDALHAIKDFSAKHILEELREHVNELSLRTGRSYLLIGESNLNDVRYINPPEKGGYGLDLQWCDEFHHALHALVTGERNGYYEDFGDIASLAKAFNDAFVYDGIYSSFRKRTFGSKATAQPGHKFVVCAQNHDQIGNRRLGDRLSSLVDHRTLKLIAGAVFVSPFVPLLFMGEEYGETRPFLYFTSHSDAELIHMVREGRKKEFNYFMGMDEPPDPQSIDTFQQSKLLWNNWAGDQLDLLHYYRTLIRLKKHHPVLKNTDRQGVEACVTERGNAILLTRKNRDHCAVAVMNFETRAIRVDVSGITGKRFYVLLDSADENGIESREIVIKNPEIIVGAKSIMVLSDIK